ncbi:MAG: hypothetical protein HPY44_16190 [Armatimonadetes bacterium]|nr:hypothetical protein [Armatimonadota bacterium]
MERIRLSAILSGLVALTLLVSTSISCAQEGCTLKLDPTGLITIFRGGVDAGAIELNAHGPNWQHAPQKSATGQISSLRGNAGKRVSGSLPIPNTTAGAAIKFVETVRTLPQGANLTYDLAMGADMKLSGVQVSVLLPVALFAGKEIVVSRPDNDPEVVALPEEQGTRGFQLWRGDGAKIEVAKGTPQAMTIQFRAAADVVIQDLRQWEQQVFEIRFPAIMEDPGRDVFADDRLHLDLTVTFPDAVTLQAP